MERYDVIVVGGGIVGAGIARDLQLRGADVLLLEKNDFATGATGRSHALLHSGARYVVKDPESAKECAVENEVLKRIAKHIVEDTGGLFVSINGYDPEDYVDKFEKGCKDSDVYCKEITPKEALELEPNLNENIAYAYWVNDGHVDPFRLTYLNILDAVDLGARAENYSEVIDFLMKNGEITGVKILDKTKNEIKHVSGDIIVIAAGAWNGILANKIGANVSVKPNRGAIIVYSRRIFKRVVNRLRPPSDGDIVVPSYGASLFGTTSVDVDNPEDYTPTNEEIQKLAHEAKVLSKSMAETRILKIYTGSRPLISAGGRKATRTFKIFNLEEDGKDNVYIIGGGKLTTYRLMAEKLGDIIAKNHGLKANSNTDKKPLPGLYDYEELRKMERKYNGLKLAVRKTYSKWGGLAKTFFKKEKGKIICLCEQVTLGEIEYSIEKLKAKSIGDVMRRTRATMGPCQGQNCIIRIAAILTEKNIGYGEKALQDIRKTLEAKWKRFKPVGNGVQYEQMQLHKLAYRLALNIDDPKLTESDHNAE